MPDPDENPPKCDGCVAVFKKPPCPEAPLPKLAPSNMDDCPCVCVVLVAKPPDQADDVGFGCAVAIEGGEPSSFPNNDVGPGGVFTFEGDESDALAKNDVGPGGVFTFEGDESDALAKNDVGPGG
eukprot:Selendium_serpulae@DN3575_c0_g1_i2.p3